MAEIQGPSQEHHRLAAGLRDRWIILIGLLALLLRLFYVHEIRSNPFFSSPYIDAREYDAAGWIMANGGHPPEASAQAPLYSLFLSLLYRLFGHNYFAVRVAQACLGAVNVFLVGTLGCLAFGRAAGRLAALFAAIYWPFIFFEGELLREVLAIHFILLGLCVLLSILETEKKGRRGLLAGLLLGLSALVRENILLFVPLAAGWVFWALLRQRLARAAAARPAILVAAGAAVAILPVSIVHSIAQGDLVLISTQGGLNFFIGNHSEMRRLAGMQPGVDWQQLLRLPDQELRLPTPAQRSRWYYREGIRQIYKAPWRWMARNVEKIWLFWTAQELMPNQDLQYYRSRSGLLSLMSLQLPQGQFPWGLFVPLAFLGFFAWRRKEVDTLLCWFVVCYMFSVVLFHVRSRYRLPAVPVILCFSAQGLASLWKSWSEKKWQDLARGLAAAALVGLLVNWPIYDTSWARKFPVNFYLGLCFTEQGNPAGAAEHFQKVLELEPQMAEAHFELGRLYRDRGLLEHAEAEFRKALRLQNRYSSALNHLAQLKAQQGKLQEAEENYLQALQIDPFYAPTLLGLGILQMERGQTVEAIQNFEKALAAEPERPSAHFYLGIAKLSCGQAAQAALHFQTALYFNPFLLEARFRLAELLELSGQMDHAEAEYMEAIRLHPRETAPYLRLGQFFAARGRSQEAEAALETAERVGPGSPEVQDLLHRLRTEGEKE